MELDDGHAFCHNVILYQVSHGQLNEITATQLAVDGDVEQRQIA